MWFFNKKKVQKVNEGFIVMRWSYPKFYGLCGRTILRHKVPMNKNNFALTMDILSDKGYEFERIAIDS